MASVLSSLLGRSFVYLAGNIVAALMPFALLPILTRYLSPSEYGQIAIFQSLVGSLSALTGLSLFGAVARKNYDDHWTTETQAHYICACFQILAVVNGFTLPLLLLFRSPLTAWLQIPADWIALAWYVSLINLVIQMRMTQWQATKAADKYAYMQVGHSVLAFSLTVILVVILAQGTSGRIIAVAASATIFSAVAIWRLDNDKLLRRSWNPGYISDALRFGLPLIPHAAGFLLLSTFDRFIINAKLGAGAAGVYMVAVQLVSAMAIVFEAINNAFVPWLYERLQRDILAEKQKIVNLTYIYFLSVLLLAALAFVIGPYLTRLIAGQSYAEAGNIVGWLALGQAFGGMYFMVTNYIFYSKKTGLLSAITIFTGITMVISLLLVIESFGLLGASMVYASAMMLRFLLTWAVAQRRHPMPWFSGRGKYFFKGK